LYFLIGGAFFMDGVQKRNIKVKDAQLGMRLAGPVYVGNILLARKDSVLDEEALRLFTTREIQYIPVYTDVELSVPVAPAPVVQKEKYVAIKATVSEKLKEETIDSVKQLFNCFPEDGSAPNKTTVYQCVNNLEGAVDDLLKVVCNAEGLLHISDLKHFDEYTYHHSLSVAMLSMVTGRELGMDNDTLFRLGRSAMLHDIGKQLIPIGLLNKKEKLTEDEFNLIKAHPMLGADSLRRTEVGDKELWDSIMHHHEKVNGKGYPSQLAGDDIPLFAKIISVADVYDAVTSYRSYRMPMLPSKAYQTIYDDIGVSFDYHVVKAFFANLEMYPVNTVVELSDERLGIVVETDSRLRLRPVVRVWGSDEIIYLTSPACASIEITGVISPSDLPPGFAFTA